MALGGLAYFAYTQYGEQHRGLGDLWSFLSGAGAARPVGAAAPASTAVPLRFTSLAPAEPTTAPADDDVPWVEVGNTDRIGVYIRRTPNMQDRLKAWPDGTKLRVIGPDTETVDLRWKNVQDPDGREGWVPAQYVIPSADP